MFFSLENIYAWLLVYKYLVLFPITIVEGPIITIIAGFLVSLGYLNILITYAVVVAGDLVGDIIHYLIGRYGGIRFVERWGRYIGLGRKQIELIEKQFALRGSKLLFIGKMTHGIGGAFLVAAGIIKMPFGKYFFSNMLATLLKSLILLIVGYYFGQAFVAINSYLEKIAIFSLTVSVTASLAYLLYHRQKNKNNSLA